MADIKYLPPEPAVPDLPGGRTRPSLEVDLAELPAIARRKELNERLLDATCAFNGPAPGRRFGDEDLDLLLLVTSERFGGEGALLRRQAVLALGDIDAGEAVRRLTDLAVAPVEHDGIRIAALEALPPERSRELLDELVEDPSPTVRKYARQLRGDETPERRKTPGQVPLDAETGPGDECACRSCRCC